MRVAVIIDTWYPYVGGGQINAWQISKRIAHSGARIDIITRDNGADLLKLPKNLQVIKLGRQTSPLDTLSKLIFLARSFLYIYSHKYDLIHAHAFLPGIVARLLMVTCSVPATFTVHGTSIGTDLLNPVARFIEKFILTEIRYSAQISTSRDFLKIKNINKNIFYIPNAVSISDFDKVKAAKFKNPTLIFVGRLHPQKNLKTLIVAISSLTRDFPAITLLIVGKGPQKQELRRLIGKMRLTGNVKFLGEKFGSDLIKLYKSSHVFVLPSIYEGQPLTLLEAWAARLPVIVTKTGDCQFLVKNGRSGYFIEDPYNPEEISKTVKKALKSPNLAHMGQNGYNLVKENFSWNKSAQKTLEIYNEITGYHNSIFSIPS